MDKGILAVCVKFIARGIKFFNSKIILWLIALGFAKGKGETISKQEICYKVETTVLVLSEAVLVIVIENQLLACMQDS
jgi:hypothetical protein